MSKAFDTINRTHMWHCMADLGIPPQFTSERCLKKVSLEYSKSIGWSQIYFWSRKIWRHANAYYNHAHPHLYRAKLLRRSPFSVLLVLILILLFTKRHHALAQESPMYPGRTDSEATNF